MHKTFFILLLFTVSDIFPSYFLCCRKKVQKTAQHTEQIKAENKKPKVYINQTFEAKKKQIADAVSCFPAEMSQLVASYVLANWKPTTLIPSPHPNFFVIAMTSLSEQNLTIVYGKRAPKQIVVDPLPAVMTCNLAHNNQIQALNHVKSNGLEAIERISDTKFAFIGQRSHVIIGWDIVDPSEQAIHVFSIPIVSMAAVPQTKQSKIALGLQNGDVIIWNSDAVEEWENDIESSITIPAVPLVYDASKKSDNKSSAEKNTAPSRCRLDAGRFIIPSTHDLNSINSATALCALPENRLVVGTSFGQLRMLNHVTQIWGEELKPPNEAFDGMQFKLAAWPNNRVASLGTMGVIRLWDVNKQPKHERTISIPPQGNIADMIALRQTDPNQDQNQLAIAIDSNVHIKDVNSDECTQILEHEDPNCTAQNPLHVTCVTAVTPAKLAVGLSNGAVQLWERE